MANGAQTLPFKLVAPSGVVLDAEVAEVELPTPGGPITILPQHMPLATAVSTGVLMVRRRASDDPVDVDHYAIEEGLLTVTPRGGAQLAASAAEHANSIDALEAERAMAEARAALEHHIEADQIVVTQRIVQRNMARLEATKLHRRHRQRAPHFGERRFD